MTEKRDDCVMYDNKCGCLSLNTTDCKDCRFFITAEEYERRNGMSYEKAMCLAQSYVKIGK